MATNWIPTITLSMTTKVSHRVMLLTTQPQSRARPIAIPWTYQTTDVGDQTVAHDQDTVRDLGPGDRDQARADEGDDVGAAALLRGGVIPMRIRGGGEEDEERGEEHGVRGRF